MARTQKVFTSRSNILADTFVGEKGRIFYDEPDQPGVAPILRYSDGITVGGIPFLIVSNNNGAGSGVIGGNANTYFNNFGDNTYDAGGASSMYLPADSVDGGGATTIYVDGP